MKQQSDAYFSDMKEKTWYGVKRVGKERLQMMREGKTILLKSSRSMCPLFLNAQVVEDMCEGFDMFEALFELVYGELNTGIMTVPADSVWYMLGFGGVIDRQNYIDTGFNEIWERV